jgi:hypothetical protein
MHDLVQSRIIRIDTCPRGLLYSGDYILLELRDTDTGGVWSWKLKRGVDFSSPMCRDEYLCHDGYKYANGDDEWGTRL